MGVFSHRSSNIFMGAVRIPMALVWLLRKYRKNKENIKSNIIECT